MRKLGKKALAALWWCLPLLALAGAVPASAETFVGVRAGYYGLAQGGEVEDLFQGLVEASSFNAGTVGVRGVHYFTPNVAAEITWDIYVPVVDFAVPTGVPDLLIPARAAFGAYPIGLAARYRFWPEQLTPVVFGGLSINPYRFDLQFVGQPQFGLEQSGVRLGYQAGAGVELPFGLRWIASADLLYRRVDFSVDFLTSDGTLLELEPNFSGFQLLVGLGYLF
jgi:hypothetical protein